MSSFFAGGVRGPRVLSPATPPAPAALTPTPTRGGDQPGRRRVNNERRKPGPQGEVLRKSGEDGRGVRGLCECGKISKFLIKNSWRSTRPLTVVVNPRAKVSVRAWGV